MSIFAHSLIRLYRCVYTRVYILQTLALQGTVLFTFSTGVDLVLVSTTIPVRNKSIG